LIDLVGLDVLALVGRNLEANLPSDDPGLAFVRLPVAEQAMLERNQLGRKTDGGFYRLVKQPDGSRQREVFDPGTGAWRPERPATLQPEHLEPTAPPGT
jgi:3-hydroxyacyl-CoA dehydrogenase